MSDPWVVLELARRFLANNLLPALVAGAVAWLIVAVGVRLFDIRHGRLRLCLFLAAPIKSTLVLLGLAPVLPWPRAVFRGWAAAAVDATVVVPMFVIVTGVGFLIHTRLASRERILALGDSRPADEVSPRLAAAYERVGARFVSAYGRIAATLACKPPVRMPALRVAGERLGSPLVVLAGHPTIVFPEALIDRLDDRQLEGALAHEVAHAHVRRHLSCTSSELVRRFTAANPFVLAVASQLELEEEKTCDDVAVEVTGDATAYADMLLTGYRYATARAPAPALVTVARLTGLRPTLSERVERLLDERSPATGMYRQRLGFWLLWVILVLVLFNG